MVNHHQQFLEPNKGLQRFLDHVDQALRMDCSLPQLQPVCAATVTKIGLLLKVLSEKKENQGASDHIDQGHLQESISRRRDLEENEELTEKPEPETMDDTITFIVLLSIIAVILLTLKGVFHVCSRCAAPVCRQLLSSQLWLRRLSLKLQQRWRKKKYRQAEDAEQDLPELSEAELLLVQYIMDVLDKEEEELQRQMWKENTDALQGETQVKN
ncbi:PREDICTED: leucine-rich repeat-containing protein 37B isoform X2 [Ficedula albicollis]|uniref:leucine-rich repeat-containing protein 37B isoform X2 n=1 Tax=Ficedula albicollis TaxID=59894 RepID=UPI000359B106|nr:PREDICTED: leucine-rich repeat-containing protein 37B isoform X2 [Ficedula albicollis]